VRAAIRDRGKSSVRAGGKRGGSAGEVVDGGGPTYGGTRIRGGGGLIQVACGDGDWACCARLQIRVARGGVRIRVRMIP
jgi:hypothetical protein